LGKEEENEVVVEVEVESGSVAGIEVEW